MPKKNKKSSTLAKAKKAQKKEQKLNKDHIKQILHDVEQLSTNHILHYLKSDSQTHDVPTIHNLLQYQSNEDKFVLLTSLYLKIMNSYNKHMNYKNNILLKGRKPQSIKNFEKDNKRLDEMMECTDGISSHDELMRIKTKNLENLKKKMQNLQMITQIKHINNMIISPNDNILSNMLLSKHFIESELANICNQHFNDVSKSKAILLKNTFSLLDIDDFILTDYILTGLNKYYKDIILTNTPFTTDETNLLKITYQDDFQPKKINILEEKSFASQILKTYQSIQDSNITAFRDNLTESLHDYSIYTRNSVYFTLSFLEKYNQLETSNDEFITESAIILHAYILTLANQNRLFHHDVEKGRNFINELIVSCYSSPSSTDSNDSSEEEISSCTATEPIIYSDEDNSFAEEIEFNDKPTLVQENLTIDKGSDLIIADKKDDDIEQDINDMLQSSHDSLTFKSPQEEHQYYQDLKSKPCKKTKKAKFNKASWVINNNFHIHDDINILCSDKNKKLFTTLDPKIIRKLDNNALNLVYNSLNKGICTKHQNGIKYLVNKNMWEIKTSDNLRIFATKEFTSVSGTLLFFDLIGDHSSYKTLPKCCSTKVKSIHQLNKDQIKKIAQMDKENSQELTSPTLFNTNTEYNGAEDSMLIALDNIMSDEYHAAD
ncbi:MAG: hypothetical protein DGJ47_000038 [Rickettsiaceae bacterium]